MTTWIVGLLENGPHNSVVRDDGRFVNTYQRKYWILALDAPSIPTETAVQAALGIDPGSPYPNDVNATCRGLKNLKQMTTLSPYIAFTVDVEWSTDATLPNDLDTDPTTGRVIWGFRPFIEQRHVNKDRNDDPILNSAGQPYDGGVPANVRLGVITARRRVSAAGYDLATANANSGKVNLTTYLGGEPGTVQVDITSDEKYEGAYHFFDEEYQFAYDPKGWQPKPLDAGFFQLVDGKLVPITVADVNGTTAPVGKDNPRVPEPEPLDGSGKVVPYADRPSGCKFVDVLYFGDKEFADFDLI